MVNENIIIVDIDGTVALHVLPDGRQIRGHHEYELVINDHPNKHIIDLVSAMHGAGWTVMFVSGRPKRAYDDTIEWIKRHMPTLGHGIVLWMREDGDFRADDVVKREIWDVMFTPYVKDRIRFAIDDRPRVIRMWAELGVPVIDVNPMSGEF